jgi:hypothetical protein
VYFLWCQLQLGQECYHQELQLDLASSSRDIPLSGFSTGSAMPNSRVDD